MEFILDCTIDHTSKTLFKNIFQLEPGCYATYQNYGLEIEKYWKFTPHINTQLNYEERTKNLETLFSNSIDLRMRSDVPVGSLLSGGLDSTSIVCDIHRRHKKKISHFLCGF